MDNAKAQATLGKIVGQVFGYQNQLTLEQFQQKFAFDVRLPQKVVDSTTGQDTWTQSVNPTRFISVQNAWSRETWEKPPIAINGIEDILTAWNDINMTTTERYLESENIAESDNIYNSERIYRSQDIHRCKDTLFCDSVLDSEFTAASQRANTLTNCIRIEDSHACSNSFSIVWSKKIVSSFFIQDCSDLQDCMFCSHMNNKRFCIANMQYSEEDYRRIKDIVVRWILSS